MARKMLDPAISTGYDPCLRETKGPSVRLGTGPAAPSFCSLSRSGASVEPAAPRHSQEALAVPRARAGSTCGLGGGQAGLWGRRDGRRRVSLAPDLAACPPTPPASPAG
jgi:hypothetical protein